jgi:hypothetical protein
MISYSFKTHAAVRALSLRSQFGARRSAGFTQTLSGPGSGPESALALAFQLEPLTCRIIRKLLKRTLIGNRPAIQKARELLKPLEINICRIRAAVMHAKSIIHRGGQSPGVPRRLHVHFGIAYQ